jgi:hypothetical protein
VNNTYTADAHLILDLDYANIWLAVEISLFLVAIIVGLYTSKDTIAQQAARSRTFLATSQHLGAGDVLSEASDSAGEWFR